jgi:hypothetical protein
MNSGIYEQAGIEMAICVRFERDDGKVVIMSVPNSVTSGLEALPEEPGRYFLLRTDCLSIPLDRLIVDHVQSKGIRNANLLMRRAYEGIGERRLPIKVRQHNNFYKIIDGSSTYINAVLSSWSAIPCEIVQ